MEKEQGSTIKFIKPVGLPPLMVVSFGIAAEREEAFNDFYNNQFLKELFSLSPELRAIKRFEKYDVDKPGGTGEGEFFTFYELDSEETLDKTDALFSHSQFASTLAQFRRYKENSLTNFARINYLPVHTIERPAPEPGLNAPALTRRYVVQIELSRADEENFCRWYLDTYQPEIFSAAPEIFASHSYIVYSPGEQNTSTRMLTIYETADEESLQKALRQLGRANFGPENTTWQAYCGDYSLLGLTMFALRAMFALP